MTDQAARRTIRHPGPAATDRWRTVACRAHPVKVRLRAGLTFGDAVAQGFEAQGHNAGYLRLENVPMANLSYVIPAPAPGDGHAAWYSATRRIHDRPRILTAGVHLGLRDGAPFTHCHGLWRGDSGEPAMGHLLPTESKIAEDCVVTGWAVSGATLAVEHDPETWFSLFQPQASPMHEGGQDALLCTLQPNQDITAAVEELAEARGFAEARIEGIGSVVGACFDAGPGLDSYATEVFLTEADFRQGQARLNSISVGFDGVHRDGRLTRLRNSVCVTAELLMIRS